MSVNHIQAIESKLKHIPRDQEGLRLWLRLSDCLELVNQEIRNLLRDQFEMTLPRFEVMSALNRVPDGLTMSELSQWLMVTKGNVTGIAERLSEDGYIRRHPTPSDRRSFCVTLTPKGEQLISRMQKAHEALLNSVFETITIEDNDMLMGILARVKESVEAIREQRLAD